MRKHFDGKVVVRAATKSDAVYIGQNMKEKDRKETWSAARMPPLKIALLSFDYSEEVFTVAIEDTPVAMFGVRRVSFLNDVGVIWLLSTDEIRKVAVAFQRYTRGYIDELLTRWSALENYVHNENYISMRWLKGAGFEVMPPAPFGVDGELFVKIRREAKCAEQ